MDSTESFSRLRSTVNYFAAEMGKEEMHLDWKVTTSFVNLLTQLTTRRFRISWFFRPEQIKAPLGNQDLRDSAWNFCRRAKGPWKWKPKPYVPRFGSHILIWLHFCSGERRADDLHHLSWRTSSSKWIRSHLSGTDVIYDPIVHDATEGLDSETWRSLDLEIVHDGGPQRLWFCPENPHFPRTLGPSPRNPLLYFSVWVIPLKWLFFAHVKQLAKCHAA